MDFSVFLYFPSEQSKKKNKTNKDKRNIKQYMGRNFRQTVLSTFIEEGSTWIYFSVACNYVDFLMLVKARR